jgi:hypothetical protein
MADTVLVQIPVSREAAAALSNEQRRAKIGKLVSGILRPSSPDDDPLAALLARIESDVLAEGLGDDEIDAELGECNVERRS